VQGERPWCPIKISLAVIGVALFVGIIVWAVAEKQ
jgi:hypothetical protein